MEYKKFDNIIIARIDKGEEILEQLKAIAITENIKLASINALGAINDFTVGVYKTDEKKYYSNSFKGYYEITSLTGTINTMDGEYYAHLHLSAGNEKGEVFGGHLNRAVVSATCELVITVIDGKVDRVYDEETGLNVKTVKIISIQDRNKHNKPVYAYGVCKIFVLCEVINGKFVENIETTEIRYLSLQDLPHNLAEEKRQGQYCPVYEDEAGTIFFASRDLCMIEYVDKFIRAGVSTLTIEARLQDENYINTVVPIYRKAIDDFYNNNFEYNCSEDMLETLKNATTRKHTTGFYLDETVDYD